MFLANAHTGALLIAEVAVGGGTPNLLALEQRKPFMDDLRPKIARLDSRKQAVGLDTQSQSDAYVAAQARLGLLRTSYGIPDGDGHAPTQVNIPQVSQATAQAAHSVRVNEIDRVSFDPVHGIEVS
jgi:oxygen-independent coproporphyrinogen III oxidase